MKIETLEDWLLVTGGCGCCTDGHSLCPTPTAETEVAYGRGEVYWFRNDGVDFYSTLRRDYSGGGSQVTTASPIHASQVGPEPGFHPDNTNVPDFTTTVTTTPPLTGLITDTLEGKISIPDARSNSKTNIFAGLDWATMANPSVGGYPDSTKTARHQFYDADVSLGFPSWDDLHDFRFVRFRWIVPQTVGGPYFKITWDVLEEPEGWDDPSPTVFRSFYLRDQTWEWTGAADPEDPEDFKSPFYEIPPPDVSGDRRIVNIRYICLRSSRLGDLPPQVMGEGVSDDEL